LSDEEDLIYEGIATRDDDIFHRHKQGFRRRRPDLRRDCDKQCAGPIHYWLARDEEDLIYEGIATAAFLCRLRVAIYPDEEDLIYEGIATRVYRCNGLIVSVTKKT